MFEIATELVLLLMLAAFVAGFIDAIAGGGGLITIPALLLAGVPPVDALGTNKLQGLCGSGSSSLAYIRGGHIRFRDQLPEAIIAALSGAAGAVLATILPSQVLNFILPLLLVGVALYFLLKPDLNDIDKIPRMTPFLFGMTIVPLIGFYDGAFGPGTGSFFMIAFISIAGYGILKATAHTKILNFSTNTGAFVIFAFSGVVLWKVGIVMGIAQFIGARLGASLAMKNGTRLIKPMLITISFLMALRVLMTEGNPLRAFIGL